MPPGASGGSKPARTRLPPVKVTVNAKAIVENVPSALVLMSAVADIEKVATPIGIQEFENNMAEPITEGTYRSGHFTTHGVAI